jgi:hypothetical protein
VSDQRSPGARTAVARSGAEVIDVVADQFEGVLDEFDVTGTCRRPHGADMVCEPLETKQVIVELGAGGIGGVIYDLVAKNKR